MNTDVLFPVGQVTATTVTGLYLAHAPGLWTPGSGGNGLDVPVRSEPLVAVVGGRVVHTNASNETNHRVFASGENLDRVFASGENLDSARLPLTERVRAVTPGGLLIVNGFRQKEPTRIVGHPDLASGASVQRGETLYVSVAEAVFRESRGESVEIHLSPTDEDNLALSELRSRARHRWENDRLPDGWTRPLPPPPSPKFDPGNDLPDDLRRLAEELTTRDDYRR